MRAQTIMRIYHAMAAFFCNLPLVRQLINSLLRVKALPLEIDPDSVRATRQFCHAAAAFFRGWHPVKQLRIRYLRYKIRNIKIDPDIMIWPCAEYVNSLFEKPIDKERLAEAYEEWGDDLWLTRKQRRQAHKLLNIK